MGSAASDLAQGWLARVELPDGATLRVEGVGVQWFAPAFVLEDAELRVGRWAVRAPRLTVRPRFASLWRGRLEPVVRARGFEIVAAGSDGLAVLLALSDWLAIEWDSDLALSLRRGTLRGEQSGELLRELAFDLGPGPDGFRLHVQARQLPGGRIDLRGRPEAGIAGTAKLDLYLDGMVTDDLRRWLSRAGGFEPAELAAEALPVAVTGRWHVLRSPAREHVHRFELDLDGIGSARRASQPGSRLSARIAGHVGLLAPANGPQASDPASRVLEGWVRARARLGRLRTWRVAGAASRRLFVSGDVDATLLVNGPSHAPRVVANLGFDALHARLDGWLRKEPGVPAWLELIHAPGSEPITRLRAEVGGVSVSVAVDRAGELVAASDWTSAEALARLIPALDGSLRGGRLRAASVRVARGRLERADLELDALAFSHPALASGATLGGKARIVEGSRLVARDLDASIAGVALRLDLDARLDDAGPSPGLRVRFDARAGAIELGDLPAPQPAEAGAGRGVADLPPALGAAAEALVLRLHAERARLAGLVLERGRIRAARVRSGGQILRDVRVDLALEALELRIERFAFRHAGRMRGYRGTIDLDHLVPELRLAALPER